MEYYLYDFRRNRDALFFEADSEEAAFSEFASWYNRVVRPSRWEKRRLGRYWLFELADGEPRAVATDEDVRLCRLWFDMCNPPRDEAEDAAFAAEFERLDALDVARLSARPANVFAEYLDGRDAAE